MLGDAEPVKAEMTMHKEMREDLKGREGGCNMMIS